MADEIMLDEAFNEQVDTAAVAKREEEALLPEATYATVPALRCTAQRVKHSAFGDPAAGGKGRRIVRYFGEVKAQVKKQTPEGEVVTEVKGFLGFDISPDAAVVSETNQQGQPNRNAGKPDGLTKRWDMAVRAYQTASGAKPQTEAEVITFIRDYSVNIRLGRFAPEDGSEPKNIVYAITAPRPEAAV